MALGAAPSMRIISISSPRPPTVSTTAMGGECTSPAEATAITPSVNTASWRQGRVWVSVPVGARGGSRRQAATLNATP